MPWNGSGVAAPPGADYPAVSLTTITAAVRNALDSDIYTCLTNCITKDGQSVVTANIPMAGFKITGMAQGTAATDAATIANANSLNLCEFRLTLTSGTPVTTADVTGAVTLYCSPYKGNHIALFNGAVWIMRSSAEFSLALGTLSSGKPYDVFCYDNAGVPTLEVLAWTNDTTRATALTLQDGVLSKTGALTRRYLGTFYTTAATTTEDSFAKRFLWNYYNRVRRPMRVIDATNSWAYTTATVRQARASPANQLDFVVGYGEDVVFAKVIGSASNTNVGVSFLVGASLDTTSAFTSTAINFQGASAVANTAVMLTSELETFPGVGRHFIAWTEFSSATGTTTWTGTNGTAVSGIYGEVWA